ncbi:MAG TPA: hypothetical protein VER79_04945 [Candidatus Limnocylindrales bacterium]|nr:hypothetical protein [Candidatus Limnocylindrales bacterium]
MNSEQRALPAHMNIEVGWYRETDRVILMRFQEDFSWEEFQRAKGQADALMDTVDRNCALVLWFMEQVPTLADMLSNGRSLLSRRHPRSQRFIIVSESSLVRSLGAMLGQITDTQSALIEVATTMAEAEQRLASAHYLNGA